MNAAGAEPAAASAARPPGLARRLAAFIYDSLLIAALLIGFAFVVVALRGMRAVAPGTWWFGAALLGLHALFYCWFWTHGGQTLGMRAWRLRLERTDGGRLDWARALVRYAAAWVSLLAAGAGFAWSWLDPQRRCWHDLLAGTRLVRI